MVDGHVRFAQVNNVLLHHQAQHMFIAEVCVWKRTKLNHLPECDTVGPGDIKINTNISITFISITIMNLLYGLYFSLLQ